MAVNIPLTEGGDGSFPLPFTGETFLLTRDRITLGYKHGRQSLGPVRGRLFMTNLRMVFLVKEQDRFKAQCESFEMPFRGLWDEKLNQPIFGANNLTASLQYYDDQPFEGNLSIKLVFQEGGVGTFLEMFNSVLRATRRQLERERQIGALSAPIAVSNNTPPVQNYMPGQSEAFVDPQDPSKIYTTQPAVSAAGRRDQAPTWSSASAAGLRRRR